MKHLYYYRPEIKSKDVELKTSVNRTYNPYKMGLIGDPEYNRDQGVALSVIKFLGFSFV